MEFLRGVRVATRRARRAEGRAEIAGLLARDGVGVPVPLCHEFETAALLLSRVQPGVSLTTGEFGAGAAAELLRRLHIPAATLTVHVPFLCERLAAQWATHTTVNSQLARPLRGGLVADAATQVERLTDSWSRRVLLHSDFEARNILHAEDGLVAIDSPAAVGDPGYDAASWLMSEHDGDAQAFRARVAQLGHALDCPEQRIWQWTWPFAVESLLDKLSQPGWQQECIGEAFEVARLVADMAAPRWHSTLLR